MTGGGNVITESLGLDRDARQAEICAKSNADIFFFPTLLCLPSAGHQQIMSPISLSPRHILRQHASMPSQWVHARGQAHRVREGVLDLIKGQGGRGGLRSLSLILLCLPLLTLAVCPVPCRFSATNSSLHPPLCSFSQVLQIRQVYRGQMGREPLVD